VLLLLLLQARCGEVDAETAALLARREQLTAVVAATPQPARSRQAAAKLRSAADKLELLSGLQVGTVTNCADGSLCDQRCLGATAVRI
jgi:hypothetical protein